MFKRARPDYYPIGILDIADGYARARARTCDVIISSSFCVRAIRYIRDRILVAEKHLKNRGVIFTEAVCMWVRLRVACGGV